MYSLLTFVLLCTLFVLFVKSQNQQAPSISWKVKQVVDTIVKSVW